jgi:methyl-accepting chemotaxis protein
MLDQREKISTPAGKEKYQELKTIWETVKVSDSKLRELALANKNAQATALSLGELRTAISAGVKLAEDVVGLTEQQMKADQDAAAATYNSTRNVLVTVVILAVLAGVAAALWIALSISQGLHKIGELAEAVAIGDLNKTVVLNTQDEARGRKAAPARSADVATQQARVKGFALDLTHGGPDADDAAFKAYA